MPRASLRLEPLAACHPVECGSLVHAARLVRQVWGFVCRGSESRAWSSGIWLNEDGATWPGSGLSLPSVRVPTPQLRGGVAVAGAASLFRVFLLVAAGLGELPALPPLQSFCRDQVRLQQRKLIVSPKPWMGELCFFFYLIAKTVSKEH